MNDVGAAGLCFIGSHCKVVGISELDQVFPRAEDDLRYCIDEF